VPAAAVACHPLIDGSSQGQRRIPLRTHYPLGPWLAIADATVAILWVGLIVLGIDKLADRRYIPRNRQLRFDYDGRSFKAKFNHRTGTGSGFSRGGIDIIEIVEGRGSPEGKTVCSITNLKEAAAFYDNPADEF
jgi:hypothetical protein